MRNVYCVKLVRAVETSGDVHHCGRSASWLYVVATSFTEAHAATLRKYPGAEVRGIDLMNYTGIPIVIGD